MTTRGIGPTKKARLTDEQVTEMMRLKREGKSISAIARIIGCHRQTVRMHLREKHGDIVAEEARKQVLIEELRGHFQNLANFVQLLKVHLDASPSEGGYRSYPTTGVMVRSPGPISSTGRLGLPGPGSAKHMVYEWGRMYNLLPRDKHLIQALREHTKDSDLWVHWDNWRKEVADYENLSWQLLLWVIDKTEPERWQKIDPEYMDLVGRWLFGNILLKTSGADYERLEGRGRDLIITTLGAEEVVVRAADSASSQALQEYLNGILKEAEQQPQWSALESATAQLREGDKQKKLKDIIGKIDSALDGIELMRAFPGRCHLCPV